MASIDSGTVQSMKLSTDLGWLSDWYIVTC